MIKLKRDLILRVTFTIFFLAVLNANAFPYIFGNGSGSGYGPEEGESIYGGGNSIETYVIEGAGCYLDGYSDVVKLLNRIEMSELKGLDYLEARGLVEGALANLKKAQETYSNLINLAEVTPYNEVVISKLTAFDYDSFMKEHDLNIVIFKRAADYLKKGDITGTYKRINLKFGLIIELLELVMTEISLNKFPDVMNLRRLNNECSQVLLFGQYIADVFDQIL